MSSPGLILASASPRRRQLLAELGLEFEVVPPDVDEALEDGESPAAYTRRVATDKARAVSERTGHEGRVILGADTAVVLGREVLGKPASPAEAEKMLEQLSGRTHQVLTGLAVLGPAVVRQQVVTTQVRFRRLGPEEIHWYVRSGEPMDKAGAYAIQGRAGAFVEHIEGSHSNVIGLPLAETLALLAEAGVPLPWRGGDR